MQVSLLIEIDSVESSLTEPRYSGVSGEDRGSQGEHRPPQIGDRADGRSPWAQGSHASTPRANLGRPKDGEIGTSAGIGKEGEVNDGAAPASFTTSPTPMATPSDCWARIPPG